MDNNHNNNGVWWHHHYPSDSEKSLARKYFVKIELLNLKSNLWVIVITSKNSEKDKDAHYFIVDMKNINKNNEFIKFRRKYKDITEHKCYKEIIGETNKKEYGVKKADEREITFTKGLFDRLIKNKSLRYNKTEKQWE